MKSTIDQIRLDDKIILITGSTDGIGKQTAINIAKKGGHEDILKLLRETKLKQYGLIFKQGVTTE